MALVGVDTNDEFSNDCDKDITIAPIVANVEIQLTDADGVNYSCKVTEDEISKIQSDDVYRTGFLEKLKVEKSQREFNLSAAGENVPKVWRRSESDLLASLRIAKDEEFQSSKVHVDLWNDISKEFSNHGFDVTSNQCSNKWKSLKRTYISAIDRRGGNTPQTFPYFNEFHELYSATPRVKLATVFSSGDSILNQSSKSKRKINHHVPDAMFTDQFNSDSDNESVGSDSTCNCVHTCHKRKRQKLEDVETEPVIEFLKEFVDLQRGYIFQQQEYLQKQDEYLARFDRHLTSMIQKKRK